MNLTELGPGGVALWNAIADDHDLDAAQEAQLTEACRAKDRLDKLDALLRGETETWAKLVHNVATEDYVLKIDGALGAANNTANLLKQLLAALRLPDAQTGKKPQRRGARGAYVKAGAGGVSSLDRARAAKTS